MPGTWRRAARKPRARSGRIRRIAIPVAGQREVGLARRADGHVDFQDIAGDAHAAGFAAVGMAASVQDALKVIAAQDPQARVLICGSLYLAGRVLRDNG